MQQLCLACSLLQALQLWASLQGPRVLKMHAHEGSILPAQPVILPHRPGLGRDGDQLEALGEGIIVAHEQLVRRLRACGDRQQAAAIGMVASRALAAPGGVAEERQEEPSMEAPHLVHLLGTLGCPQVGIT